MRNLVEGIDYIFDRYAWLGLASDARLEDIKTALKKKRSENHPDRLAGASEEVQQTAQRQMAWVVECENVLLNKNTRSAYDARLAEFKAEKPELVSDSGAEILDSRVQRIDLSMLLDEQIPDMSFLEDHLLSLSKFDSQQLDTLRTLYEQNPDNVDFKNLLRDALTKALQYWDHMEDFAWNKAGFFNFKKSQGYVASPEEYLLAVEEQFAHIQDSVLPETVQQNADVLKIGVSAPLLLTYAGEEAGHDVHQLTPDQTLAVTTHAQENFAVRTEEMRDMAKEKQAILKELTLLSDVWYLTGDRLTKGLCDLLLLVDGTEDATVALAFRGEDGTQNLVGVEDSPCIGRTIEELQAMQHEHDTIAILFNPDLNEPLMPIGAFFGLRQVKLKDA